MVGANRRIVIAVDAMGGDFAPGEIVKGAVMAAEKNDAEVVLVGLPDIVEAELAKYDTTGLPLRFVPADDSIPEGKNPALSVRNKPNASIAVAARMVRTGKQTA